MLLHGMIASAETFARVADQLQGVEPEAENAAGEVTAADKSAAGAHLIALNLPGSGSSDRGPAVEASFVGLAGLVRAFVEQLELRRPILVGHSFGGALALTLAVAEPEFACGLILLCPAHPFSRHEERLVAFYLTRPGRAFAHLLPRLPRQLHLMIFRRLPGRRATFDDKDLEPYLSTLRGQGTVAYLLRVLARWNADMAQLRGALERTPLATPVLLLWGDGDLVVPLATAGELLNHLQNAELVTLRGVGHLPNEEAPRACAEAMLLWMEHRGRTGDHQRADHSAADTVVGS